MSYYNRYKDFKINGANKTIPLITVPKKSSDKYLVYKVGKSRLDKISQQIYNTPYFGWLILQSNPEYGGQEWNIPDQTLIIVPFYKTTKVN